MSIALGDIPIKLAKKKTIGASNDHEETKVAMQRDWSRIMMTAQRRKPKYQSFMEATLNP
jgi:hypothetical protein